MSNYLLKYIKARFLFLKNLITNSFEPLVIVPAGILYYKLFLAQENHHTLVICPHIGDFLYTIGYANALISEKQIQNLQIVSVPKFQPLIKFYPNLQCHYRSTNKHCLNLLLAANRYEMGQKVFRGMKNISIVEPGTSFVLGLDYAKNYPGLTLKDTIRFGSLGLSSNSVFEKPINFYKSANKSHRKKVLLSLSAQVMDGSDLIIYFRHLINELITNGYDVFINEDIHELQNPNTTILHWSLDELFKNCNTFHSVIGLRSGLLDLAAFTNCRVIAIYPTDHEMFHFFDIRKTNPENKHVFQYMLTGNTQNDITNTLKLNEENRYES